MAVAQLDRLERAWTERGGAFGWITTTDHKRIGILYFFTTLAFFAAGGVEALLIRTQLIGPNEHVLSPEAYNQAFTMHGITMIFLFVIPMTTGAFGNYLLPLMIGARDMAFPRMNALSYWIFLGSGVFIYTGLAIGQAPDAGWFDYVPLANRVYSPGPGIDFYCLGLIFTGISSTLASINFITTIFKLRAPGMSINRMPLFCYAFLAVSFALLFALPPLNAALVFLELDRRIGTHFYDVAQGGDPLLWQHLFWIFGHPEVYIIILPAFGIATSIIPTFAKRKMVAYPLVALAEVLVAFLGFGVWVHHMFATGLPTVTTIYFAAVSLIIVIPSAVQIFAWITTLVTGRPEFRTPLLFIVGFILWFVLGGLSGIMFAAIPFDQQATDTYFVVAHFHFVIFGAAVFPILGGIYYWFPKLTGRMYHERLGQASFWLTFLGTLVTFFPMHIVGLLGMPRRNYTYAADRGWTFLNALETVGAYVLAAGLLLIVANLVWSRFRGPAAGDDPFGGDTLEWSVSSPPPAYNFAVIPTISSPYANWDADDREADRRRLEQGVHMFAGGHETVVSTGLDGVLDEVIDMPSDSPWPPLLGLSMTIVFVFLLTGHYATAIVFTGVCGAILAAWHWPDGGAVVETTQVRALPKGLWAMALAICTEGAFFGVLVASYFYLQFNSGKWPPVGIEAPSVALPLALTAALVATAVPMWFAARARNPIPWVAAATLVQAGYLAVQIVSYLGDLGKFSVDGTAYGSVYFTLLGAHHAHVAVGLLLNVWLLASLARGMTPYRRQAVRVVSWYWYFVAAVGVLVVAAQVSPS